MANRMAKLASKNAVVIFGGSNCCVCHAVKMLFTELGVSWTLHELDKDPWGNGVERALAGMVGRSPTMLVVFIDGRFGGPTEQVMTLHLGGQVVPLLRQAGALWL